MAADPKRSEAEIYTALGEMLVKWNHVESLMRFLVVWMYGLGDKGDILTVHMGNTTLADALTTLTTEFGDETLKPHILHFVAYVDRVRAYRNYYAHGIAIVGFIDTGEPVGALQQMQARGQLILSQEQITVAKIQAVTEMCQVASRYGSAISAHVMRDQDFQIPQTLLLSLQDKPQLPAQLTKPRLNLREHRRQHSASQE